MWVKKFRIEVGAIGLTPKYKEKTNDSNQQKHILSATVDKIPIDIKNDDRFFGEVR